MTGNPRDGDDIASVPIDAIPEPAGIYEVRDGEPVVTGATASLRSTFAGLSPETPLREWSSDRRVAVVDGTFDDVCSSLAAGESVDATLRRETDAGDRTYRLRSTGDASPPGTTGLFTLTPRRPAADDAVEVDRIASVVSHDLRNPLDVATAHLQAARERGDAEHFDAVERAHGRMERIVRDVLTLARGEGVIDPDGTVALDRVATDAWDTVDTGDATLDLDAPGSTIEADPDRLQRLFENLFRNSIEHGSANDGTLRVRVGRTEDGFFVADDGRGVPPADRERVFEPGYSTDDTGTGLGLTIVERIAEAHGWSATILESDRGGARFEFRDRERVSQR